MVLRGLSKGGPCVVSFKCIERLFRHDQIEWVVECIVMSSNIHEVKRTYPPDVQELLAKRSNVFDSIPLGRPLDRGIEHVIELEEGNICVKYPF